MTKYLVPLDGSSEGEAALRWAKFLSNDEQSQIELLRCFHPLASAYTFSDFATPPPASYDLSGFIRHSEKYLNVVAKEHGLGDVTTTVREGDAANIILEQSESADVDCILMSSHGRTGLGRWLMGSVTTKIVRASHKPVLVVRPKEGGAEEPALKRILVCLDGSKLAERSLKPALELAQRFDSELVLFRGVALTPYPAAELLSALQEEFQRDLQESKAYLESLAREHPSLKITTKVEIAPIVSGILAAAKESDLVVMTSDGRGALSDGS